ncbi:ABC transporter permease [Sulfurospirillum barnesii]|uniref:ABC-type dipeptide/oligopeptide/nickel transport system, permease component n=1 Tax=Sulfurospirillum barnesii (strain ATCC 700032 / DSM 10660 / SES-3) TaxID=760154 RepID=I3XWU5_SULBS|nr:ABC transporter permease [Sulfurospirillum barnesii]AFL68419.1 ABC-type dipeptide/oligopeptide/nickel transport system, permease component [Sulfurospirillum barnesii SES-3]
MKRFPLASTTVLVLIFLFCFGGPLFYTVSAYDLNPSAILLAPNSEYLLGTDRLGRDLCARLMLGGQTSLIIGLLSAMSASLLGLMVGISAGFFQKGVDKFIIIMIDLFLTFPTFFLLLALISYMSASLWVLVFVISITGWMGMARLIRSESFAISQAPFIKILRLSHVASFKIIFKYFAPLLAPIFFISFTFGVSGAILAESGLSFLGIGITPPQMSWGVILSEGKEVIDIAWWLSFFPGFFIFLVTFSLINLSDYLQAKSNEKDSVNDV